MLLKYYYTCWTIRLHDCVTCKIKTKTRPLVDCLVASLSFILNYTVVSCINIRLFNTYSLNSWKRSIKSSLAWENKSCRTWINRVLLGWTWGEPIWLIAESQTTVESLTSLISWNRHQPPAPESWKVMQQLCRGVAECFCTQEEVSAFCRRAAVLHISQHFQCFYPVWVTLTWHTLMVVFIDQWFGWSPNTFYGYTKQSFELIIKRLCHCHFVRRKHICYLPTVFKLGLLVNVEIVSVCKRQN